METRHKVINLIILDESGSMQSIKNSIIQGFNEVVQTIKGVEKQFPEQEHIITLLTFNGLGHKYLLENVPVCDLIEIDDSKYHPDAMTPLYDAMGFSIQKLRSQMQNEKDYNILVTILTDGEENSSKEFDGKAIKSLVEELKAQNWTFTYIGTEHEVEKSALSISITNTIVFKKNQADMDIMFNREKNARMNYSRKIRDKEDTTEDFYKET